MERCYFAINRAFIINHPFVKNEWKQCFDMKLHRPNLYWQHLFLLYTYIHRSVCAGRFLLAAHDMRNRFHVLGLNLNQVQDIKIPSLDFFQWRLFLQNKKPQTKNHAHGIFPETAWFSYGRGDKIRTCGPYVPNVVLYQTEPHLDEIASH